MLQLNLLKLFKEYLSAPRTKNQVIFELTRFCSALIFASLGYGLSKFVLFQYKPFLGVPVVGEVLSGCLFFAIIYYLVPIAIRASLDYLKQFLKENSFLQVDFVSTFNALSKARKERVLPKIKETKENAILLDTSSIIDGRIYSLIEQGFISSLVIVPQFVLDELQLISDSADKLKREKGRRGLKILENIKKIHKNKFMVYPYKRVADVDKELVFLARKINSKLATVDFNLNKVASISKVKVLNVNTLANALKTQFIPGDSFPVKIIKEGSGREQGIGYLSDGTMIVVNKAKKYVGKEVNIIISKSLQTEAGLLLFADIS